MKGKCKKKKRKMKNMRKEKVKKKINLKLINCFYLLLRILTHIKFK